MPSVKLKRGSEFSPMSSPVSNGNGHATLITKIRQTNLMDFFFNNSKENQNNNGIASNGMKSESSADSAKKISESKNNANEVKSIEVSLKPQITSQDLSQLDSSGNMKGPFAMRRSRRQSVCEDEKFIPKRDKEEKVSATKSVFFDLEKSISEQVIGSSQVNDVESTIPNSEPETSKPKKDETAFAARRSRRQSICVEKLTYDKVKPKKVSYKKYVDEIEPLPDLPADDPKPEEIVVDYRNDETLKAVKTPCSTSFNTKLNVSNYIDPMAAMLIRIAAKDQENQAEAIEEPSTEIAEVQKPPKIDLEKLPTETVTNNKRPFEHVESTTEEVKQSAKRQKINETQFDETDPPDQPAVIEEIIEDIWYVSLMTFDKEPVVRFLVKWDGFPPSENTLEPFEHVSHAEILQEYVKRKFEMHQDRIDAAVEKLAMEAKPHFEAYQKKTKMFIMKKLAKFDVLHFKCNILAYIYTYEKIPHWCLFLRHLRSQCVLYKFFEKADKENEMNKSFLTKIMKKEKNVFKVTAENKLDYDAIPQFEYLRNVDFPKKSKSNLGCQCVEACNESSNCCPSFLGVKNVYDVDGRICALSHQMIVECNDYCACDRSCPNRPKQTRFNLCVFKTPDRGWAVKTLETIPAGTFVIQYTGELIGIAEAKKRARVYKKLGITYLFDLDYNEQNEATYSLDATYKGNLSRFINHSCNANLQTWPATSCNDMPDTHRLYYFSLRTIRAGEELTVDYSGGVIRPIMSPPKDAIPCKCNSENCRGFIF